MDLSDSADCVWYHARLAAYVAGELNGDEHQAVLIHLAGCVACSQQAAEVMPPVQWIPAETESFVSDPVVEAHRWPAIPRYTLARPVPSLLRVAWVVAGGTITLVVVLSWLWPKPPLPVVDPAWLLEQTETSSFGAGGSTHFAPVFEGFAGRVKP